MRRVLGLGLLLVLLLAFAPVAAAPGVDHLAACEHFGTLLDGRALWAGDCVSAPEPAPTATATNTEMPTDTPTAVATGTATVTEIPEPTQTDTSAPSATFLPTVFAPETPAAPQIDHAPWPSAPLCERHSMSEFHALWNAGIGCHYDHEHGQNPFTGDVAAVFPDVQLYELLGQVEIGHTNPSSPMENTHKHGGFKWDVNLSIPCEPFEGAANCVTAAVIQYHAFGDYSVEFESRIHSTAALLKICTPDLAQCGYLYTVQHQEYGQRVTPYQGAVLAYPDTPLPAYGGGFGPYNTLDCVHPTAIQCRASLAYVTTRKLSANSIWTSKPTGTGARPATSSLFRLLFRVRDTYQLLDYTDLAYPFTFRWLCGDSAYNPAGCRYNNTTTRVHEVAGTVPAGWDALEGYTTRFGTLNPACTAPGPDCFPVRAVGVPAGSYGQPLPGAKVSNPTAASNPERDIYFCGLVVCAETDAGAVPSGWVGPNN